MKVTNIKQQVKRQDRYSIYVDKKYVFSLSEAELLNIGIKIGQEFSPQELEELKQKAVLDKTYDRALNLISRRRRSEWELRDYLKRKDYDEDVIQQTLNRLSEKSYVNDKTFAEAWVANRRLLKSTSKRRLQQELRQKRVPDEVIQDVLEADETDEIEVLKDLIARKRKQSRYQDDLKLMQYLVRQGYSYGDIKTALSGS
jgi:regulatory protein